MIKTIIAILIALVGIGLVVFAGFAKRYANDKRSDLHGVNPRPFLLGGASALIISVLLSLFTIVPAGHTGVLVTAGRVSDTVMQAGAHLKVPLVQNIVNVDNRVQRSDVEGSGASKDLQTVSANISVNYHVSTAASATLYSSVGSDWDTVIVRPAVQECMKSVMSQFTAEELITKRQAVGDLMSGSIAEKVGGYGLNVDSVNILNMDFSEEFNAAIEAKQTAQQSALKAEQDLARIQVEAQQKIVEAQADADANLIRSESITDKILMSEYLEKWDGKLPAVVGDSGQLLDITSMIGK